MATMPTPLFSDGVLDTLQEIISIALVQAEEELGDLANTSVQLRTPEIRVKAVSKLASHMAALVKDLDRCSIVEQNYGGGTDGLALMVFPHGAERKLLSFFHADSLETLQSDPLCKLEMEVLTEVGNILISACVGKLFELLQTQVSYLPPRAVVGQRFGEGYPRGKLDAGSYAIIIRTDFASEDASGFLCLISDDSSVPALRGALSDFRKRAS